MARDVSSARVYWMPQIGAGVVGVRSGKSGKGREEGKRENECVFRVILLFECNFRVILVLILLFLVSLE